MIIDLRDLSKDQTISAFLGVRSNYATYTSPWGISGCVDNPEELWLSVGDPAAAPTHLVINKEYLTDVLLA